MPIRIGGLATGLDTDNLVKQLMHAKRMPVDRMKQQRTASEWQRDDYRNMNTLLSSLRDVASTIKLQSGVGVKKASSNDATSVTATALATAVNGNYTLKVTQLASTASMSSTATLGQSTTASSLTSTDVTLNVTGQLGTQSVKITAGSTIYDVVNSVNLRSGSTGVKAYYDQSADKITFTSTQTGSTAKVQIADTTAGSTFLSSSLKLTTSGDPQTTAVVNGKDAIVNLNGLNSTISSNTFKLQDITFTLKKDPTDPATQVSTPYTVSVSVAPDIDTIVTNIKGFVDKYNETIDKINAEFNQPRFRDYQPLTDDQKAGMKDSEITAWEDKAKSGMLHNDSILSDTLDRFRRVLSDPVTSMGSSQYDTLYSIGIKTSSYWDPNSNSVVDTHGHLELDVDKLRATIADHPDDVMNLFTNLGDGNAKGIAGRLYDAANSMMSMVTDKAGSPDFLTDNSVLGKQISGLNSQINESTSRLADYEQQYYSQFASLESAINKMNQQSAWLAKQFGGGSSQ